VAITRDGQTVALEVGANVGVVNGRRVQLDVPAFICEGRVLVPLRFIGEALGACVTTPARAPCASLELLSQPSYATLALPDGDGIHSARSGAEDHEHTCPG
jgi:hypothetical protein